MMRRGAMRGGVRGLHSAPERKAVRVVNLEADPNVSYPTLYNGLRYEVEVFGRRWTTESTKEVQKHVWNSESFLPSKPAATLEGTPFAVLSDIASQQAVTLPDGSGGLLSKNELRNAVNTRLCGADDRMKIVSEFIDGVMVPFTTNPTPEAAQLMSNVAFWSQWLIRGYLFEGKLFGEKSTAPAIPAPLSCLAYASNAALGRHQIEFVYDDYTLKAAEFPTDRTFLELNYDDPQEILRYIADIKTPVGFLDRSGPNPEHNFRHNHSLMEQQMKLAFSGYHRMSADNASADDLVQGWTEIAEAARRAHLVFKTMMSGTPAASYPMVRLPIKGVRGACGNVYPTHGVFYENCGTDTYISPDGVATSFRGCYVDWEYGQTGANSSMYKWLDVFAGVSEQRNAYTLAPACKNAMVEVIAGKMDPGVMGTNPIDSMQRAFDLLTRPPLHLQSMVDVSNNVNSLGLLRHREDPRLADRWEEVAYQRLRLAFYVAAHRCVHGKYVLKMIYQTKPVGGQSRAEGTGGSTPPFLKTFFDQTFTPAKHLVAELQSKDARHSVLSEDAFADVARMAKKLYDDEEMMTTVQQKGLQLEAQENKSKARRQRSSTPAQPRRHA
eukprot:Hpha_TRINITY_DN14430_c0_g5::TRINITY_DN14430_c0_g5_i1::g.157502::m.157502